MRYFQSRQCLKFESDKFSRHGFSILELLLAFGIAAAMGTSIYMVYSNAIRLERQSARESGALFDRYMIYRIIEDDLSRSVPYRYRLPGSTEEKTAFTGETERLTFVTETPQGLVWVEYALVAPSDGVVRTTRIGERLKSNKDQIVDKKISEQHANVLVRRSVAFKGMPPVDTSEGDVEILSDEIDGDGIVFNYSQLNTKGGFVWAKTWGRPELPAAVRIDMNFIDDAAQRVRSKVLILPQGF